MILVQLLSFMPTKNNLENLTTIQKFEVSLFSSMHILPSINDPDPLKTEAYMKRLTKFPLGNNYTWTTG